jgi:predicted RNA-binding protein with PIN domain
MPVLIDGYNLLRVVQKQEQFAGMDEAELCRMLEEYLSRTRDRGQVIFDGIGPPDKSRLGPWRNMEVYFVGQRTDADTIIEERIKDCSAPRSLIVVSSDRRLKTAAKHRKAVSIGAEDFWGMLCKTLEKDMPRPEPQEKRRGITDAETDRWMDLFDLK